MNGLTTTRTPDNMCWNPKTLKWEKCKATLAKGTTPRGTGTPPRTCLPPACCIDFAFFQQLTACIFNLNSAFSLPASYFVCGGLGGGMTFTQFWRAFTVSSPCRYQVLADGTIYDADNDVNIACYKTGTVLTNEGDIIPPGGLAQCLALISQSPDCPDIQICWVLTQVDVGGGNCIRRIDNVKYCTQPYGTIDTVADFINCTNCQGSGVVVVPACNITPDFNLGVGLSAVIGTPVPADFTVDVDLTVPVCCEGGDFFFDMLTPEFSTSSFGGPFVSGPQTFTPTIVVNPLTTPGVYNIILKFFYQCPGFGYILIPIPLRVTVTP